MLWRWPTKAFCVCSRARHAQMADCSFTSAEESLARMQVWEDHRRRARRRGAPPPPPAMLRLTAIYLENLPAEEIEAAVGADAMAFGADSGHASDAARVLRTQALCQQSAALQQRML